ncbi:MAG: winged helix-turn-helix transcriptional regulator [Candidatus Omnitrophica bacterium]|nr:winged helix-turn-helix transcriptional regulator [Candidatus Omnitrophota bacterium]
MINNQLTFLQPTAIYRELILLEEIGRNPKVTQGILARKAGIVPAMVNNYIKSFVKEGHITVDGNKTRNMTYSLTVEGERKKFNLLISYVKETVSLYKNAKEGIKARLYEFKAEGIKRVVLYGAADTAELTYSAAEEIGLKVMGIVDSDIKKQGKEFLGKKIANPQMIHEIIPDAVVIASFGCQNQIYEEIKILEHAGIKVRKL